MEPSIIQPPVIVNLAVRECSTVFQPLKNTAGWKKDEDVVTAALYVGGIILLHELHWKQLLVLDPQMVAIPGFSRHIVAMKNGDFWLFDEPCNHLEQIVKHFTPVFDPEKGAFVLDQVISHVLPAFVHTTGGGDDGGGELLKVASQIRDIVGFRLAA